MSTSLFEQIGAMIIKRDGGYALSGPAARHQQLRQRIADGEDQLDYCHRLLKLKVSTDIVAEKTGLPVESVEHVLRTNAAEWE